MVSFVHKCTIHITLLCKDFKRLINGGRGATLQDIWWAQTKAWAFARKRNKQMCCLFI